MSKLDKKICKIAKNGLKKKMIPDLFAEVRSPRYLCKKCLRVASDKDLICVPLEIE